MSEFTNPHLRKKDRWMDERISLLRNIFLKHRFIDQLEHTLKSLEKYIDIDIEKTILVDRINKIHTDKQPGWEKKQAQVAEKLEQINRKQESYEKTKRILLWKRIELERDEALFFQQIKRFGSLPQETIDEIRNRGTRYEEPVETEEDLYEDIEKQLRIEEQKRIAQQERYNEYRQEEKRQEQLVKHSKKGSLIKRKKRKCSCRKH